MNELIQYIKEVFGIELDSDSFELQHIIALSQDTTKQCDDCDGTGTVMESEYATDCYKCGGSGRLEK
jgi:DnaJ-class molecular chaperone